MSAIDGAAVTHAVLGLDRWLESMRVDWPTPGYGGPVVHWWNHSLAYQGAGLDWRYEGIIDGYLTLWRTSDAPVWLDRAMRAGDDLVEGQRPDGHFINSQFELNPGTGGTPHEAAADVGLLLLAQALSERDPIASGRYLATAQRNLETYWFGQLWHEPTRTLRDGLDGVTFVPNKACTFIEAVVLLAELTGDDTLLERYALPTAEHVLAMQVHAPGDRLDGAIAQNRFGDRIVASYFSIYIARCVSALTRLAILTSDARYRTAVHAVIAFLQRTREPDGGLPMVLYPEARANRFPRWIAGVGDVLRAYDVARDLGSTAGSNPTLRWILRGARPDGRIATAEGFGRIVPLVSRREASIGDIGIVGWCDKAFRALASRMTTDAWPAPGLASNALVHRTSRWDQRVLR